MGAPFFANEPADFPSENTLTFSPMSTKSSDAVCESGRYSIPTPRQVSAPGRKAKLPAEAEDELWHCPNQLLALQRQWRTWHCSMCVPLAMPFVADWGQVRNSTAILPDVGEFILAAMQPHSKPPPQGYLSWQGGNIEFT